MVGTIFCTRVFFSKYNDLIEFTLGCEDEREAALILGFNAESWSSSQVQQPASTKKTWVEMTDEEKAALVVLGYSVNSWDNREPHSSYKLWGDLTDDEKIAAEMLGYRAAKWNKRAGDHVRKDWPEMTNDEQVALEILGFTQTLWDEGTFMRPISYFKSWDQLTVCGESPSCTR